MKLAKASWHVAAHLAWQKRKTRRQLAAGLAATKTGDIHITESSTNFLAPSTDQANTITARRQASSRTVPSPTRPVLPVSVYKLHKTRVPPTPSNIIF